METWWTCPCRRTPYADVDDADVAECSDSPADLDAGQKRWVLGPRTHPVSAL